MKSIFGDVKGAVGQAFTNVQDAFKIESDPELKFYDTLKGSDFEKMRSILGEDSLVSYIQKMEARKLKGKV